MQLTSVGRLRGIKIACVNAFILGFLSAGVVQAFAAELKPATIRMDFILGGKHTPWFVALEKGFYAKRGLAATIQAGSGSAVAKGKLCLDVRLMPFCWRPGAVLYRTSSKNWPT